MTSAPEDVLNVATRRLLPEDIFFIFNSWKMSYRRARQKDWTPKVNNKVGKRFYYDEVHRRITRVLKRGPKVVMACDPLDPKHLFGWIVTEPPIVHYVYVKETYRRAGVALQLLAASGLASKRKLYCTHWTPVCESLAAGLPIVNIEV